MDYNVYIGNNTEHVHHTHQKEGNFFFSIALVSIRYMPPKITTSRIAPIQMLCFFWAAFFSLAYTYARSSSSLRLCFSSRCALYSSSLCLAFSYYFSFLRTTLSSALLFSNSTSLTLAFSSPARMASIVCPFLLRREGSQPRLLPAASNFIVMVWQPLRTASWRAVLPSLFWALKKNCLSRGVSTGSLASLSRTATTQSPLLARTASIRHVLSWSSLLVYFTPCCIRKWKLSDSGAERERFKYDPWTGMRSLGSICYSSFFRISGWVCSLRAKQRTNSPLLFLFRGSAFSSSSLVTMRGSLSLTAISKGNSPSLVGRSRSMPGNLEKRVTACSSSPSMAKWSSDLPVFGSSSLRLGFSECRSQLSFQSYPLRSSLIRVGSLLIDIIIPSTVVKGATEGNCVQIE